MSARPLPVVLFGLGPIGRAVAREIAVVEDLALVAACDPSPRIAGKDLGALTGKSTLRGIRVTATPTAAALRRAKVAVQTTLSRFPDVLSQLRELAGRGLPVVGTCEELVAARIRWPKEAAALDALCRRAGVRVLPAGINPGFLMDLLPAVLASPCVNIRSVLVRRYVDTSKRRVELQRKTGAGLEPAEFMARAREGCVGHVGLRDSLLDLVDRLGMDAEITAESIQPVLTSRRITVGRTTIDAGRVVGVHQTVKAKDRRTGRAVAVLDLEMAFGHPMPHDEVRIDGDPIVHARFDGGVHGDRGTVGTVLRGVRRVRSLPPGFGLTW